ncbi:hypothetical protein HYH03_004754 [Edaphochlamys debaryana]|uniref:Uncharacterized protein n=1 Tax=Edaphochlamys debaryana TaxID=47281 RepID=A0A835YGE9_9CHLO|nr:hypothetical protein HYH03_004754 [Edaphochlamys debaryana]|eukprot:KAG2497164.1 hypothetical protein HYH03_004754 [Edaphochlamys debaryana]
MPEWQDPCMTAAEDCGVQFAKEAVLPVPETLNAILVGREEAELLTAVEATLSEVNGLNFARQLCVRGALVALHISSGRLDGSSAIVIRRLHSVDLSRQLVRVDGGEVHPLVAVLPGPPTAQQWREACRELAGRLLRGEAEHATAAELRSVCERLAVLQWCAAELPAPGQPLDAARRKALEGVLAASADPTDGLRGPSAEPLAGTGTAASTPVDAAGTLAAPAAPPAALSASKHAGGGLTAAPTTPSSLLVAENDGPALKRARGGCLGTDADKACEGPDAKQQRTSAHGDWRTVEDWARDVHRFLLSQPGCKMAWADIARAGYEIPGRFKPSGSSLTGFLYTFPNLWTLSDPKRPKDQPLELTAIPHEARRKIEAEVEAKWPTAEDWARDVHRFLLSQPGCKMAWLDIVRSGFEVPTRFKPSERSLTGFLYTFPDLWTLSDPNRPKHLPLELTAIAPGEARRSSEAEAEAKWPTAEDWARDLHRHLLSQPGRKMTWAQLARSGFEVPLKLKPRNIGFTRFLRTFSDLWTLSDPNRPKDQPLELTAIPPGEAVRGRSRERSRAEQGRGGSSRASGSPPRKREPRDGSLEGAGRSSSDGGGDKGGGGAWPSAFAWAEAVYRYLLEQPDHTVKVSRLHTVGLGLPDKFLGGLTAAGFLGKPELRALWTIWNPKVSAPLQLTAQPGALEPWLEWQRERQQRQRDQDGRQEREWERERERGAPGSREVDRERSRERGEKDRSGRRRKASVERGGGDASPRRERHASRPGTESGPSPAPDSEEGFKRRVATFLSEQPGRSATMPSLCKAGLSVPSAVLGGRSPSAWYRQHKSLWRLSKDDTLTLMLADNAFKILGLMPE